MGGTAPLHHAAMTDLINAEALDNERYRPE